MPQPALFETSDDELLISVYARQGRTLDDLPYTQEFESIYAAMVGDGGQSEPLGSVSRSSLFHRLHNLRKAGRLPRLGRAVGAPPRIAGEHEQALIGLVEEAVGKLSLRDNLPYTPAFDELVTRFNAQVGANLLPHDVWRIIAKLAK
jgi:hypothetical protein